MTPFFCLLQQVDKHQRFHSCIFKHIRDTLQVWREFPDRIVGFPPRNVVWNNDTQSWKYDSEWTNEVKVLVVVRRIISHLNMKPNFDL